MRCARPCGRFLGPRNFGRRRRRGELLAARLVRQSFCGSPGGAGMVALNLQLLHERVGRCQRVGRARSRDRPPPADDGNSQPVRKPPCPGGPPMDPTELRLRDPGSRRAVDLEHGGFRRLAERRPVRNADRLLHLLYLRSPAPTASTAPSPVLATCIRQRRCNGTTASTIS